MIYYSYLYFTIVIITHNNKNQQRTAPPSHINSTKNSSTLTQETITHPKSSSRNERIPEEKICVYTHNLLVHKSERVKTPPLNHLTIGFRFLPVYPLILILMTGYEILWGKVSEQSVFSQSHPNLEQP